MTIASTTSRISYTGDSSTTAFSVPFYFQTNADLVVYLQDTLGVATLQTLGTNYTLTGATVPSGGTCTFTSAPTTGYLVTIYRDPALTQTTSYNNNDPFPAKSHELALDKALTIDQRTRDIAVRSLHLSDAEAASTGTLASVATRKNKLLGFDTTGALSYVVGPTFVNSTNTGVAEVDSKATAQTLTFAGTVNIVRTNGNATPGDGGGLSYVRGIISSPTPFQDAGGVYWTPATPTAATLGNTTFNGTITYGGVTLTNAVTGTGSMALSASPTFTGTLTGAAASFSSTLTYGGVTLANSVTGTGSMALSASPGFTGVPTAPTASAWSGNTQLATTAFVLAAVAGSNTSAVLGADVNVNNTANYFDGPALSQGTAGTWFVQSTLTVTCPSASQVFCKLWDGTTVIASAVVELAAGSNNSVCLSGIIASPAAGLKMSVRNASFTTGKIVFNASGNSKDGTISAQRIA